MTLTDSEVDLSQLFDFSIECDNPNCEKDATWSVTSKCCQTVAVVCNEHLEQLKKMFKQGHENFIEFLCAHCQRQVPALFSDYVDVEPL